MLDFKPVKAETDYYTVFSKIDVLTDAKNYSELMQQRACRTRLTKGIDSMDSLPSAAVASAQARQAPDPD
jgi:hypothetical protein